MKQKRKRGKRYHGLKNQGATCYLNSVLQVLNMTKDFREAVSQSSPHNHGCIDHHLSSVFNTLTNETASTQEITNHLGISKVNEQHDAAECFDKILSCSSLKASKIFQGELTHNNTCYKCERETKSNSPFWSLPLTLSETEYYCVADGIQKYFQESKICGESQLYCCQCNEKTDSSIKLEMHHHPDVLTLLLKRFKFDYHHMDYVKIKCHVQIPVTLSIPTVENKSQTYELYAYVEHSGELRSGHYTVTIKPQDDDRWYTFNDSMVTLNVYQPFQVDDKETSSGAYLLFYRKSTHPSIAHSTGASGCSKSNEPCGEDVETTERQEGERPATTTEYEKTQNRVEMTMGMVVGDDQSKMTGTNDDRFRLTVNNSPEYIKPSDNNIDSHRNCMNSRRLEIDRQTRDEPRGSSGKPNDLKQNLKPVQNKRRRGNKQVVHDRKKRKGDVDSQCKQDVSDTLSENCPRGLCGEHKQTEWEDQKEPEQTRGIGNLSETGGNHQDLYLANANENGLNQDGLQEEQQDPAGTNEHYSSAKKHKTPSVERFESEETTKHLQSHTNDDEERKIKSNDGLKQNMCISSHEGSEGKEENPKNDQCCQTRERSERLFGESEGNQKTVKQDKDCQNKLQGDVQFNPVTEKNTQKDTKADDGKTLSDCISMLSRKNLLEQQRQSDEEISTGSKNIENVNDSKSLTESDTEKKTQVSLGAQMQHGVGNGSGKIKKQNKKQKNKKQNLILSRGLSYPRPHK